MLTKIEHPIVTQWLVQRTLRDSGMFPLRINGAPCCCTWQGFIVVLAPLFPGSFQREKGCCVILTNEREITRDAIVLGNEKWPQEEARNQTLTKSSRFSDSAFWLSSWNHIDPPLSPRLNSMTICHSSQWNTIINSWHALDNMALKSHPVSV